MGAADTFALTTLETIGVMIAALCHDIGHPGVNNTFLVQTNDELALRYNDRSVLESMHCSLTFSVLRDPACLFLPKLTDAAYRELRNIVITAIMGTDMQQHFGMMAKLESRLASTLDVRQAAERLFLVEVLVHAADVSNVGKPWDAALRWSTAVSTEFFAQGDRVRNEGQPVEPFMVRLSGFFSCLVFFHHARALQDRTKSSVEKNTANFIRFVGRVCRWALAPLMWPPTGT